MRMDLLGLRRDLRATFFALGFASPVPSARLMKVKLKSDIVVGLKSRGADRG